MSGPSPDGGPDNWADYAEWVRAGHGPGVHGTYPQYQKEVRTGQSPCPPCAKANRLYLREYRLRTGRIAVPVAELKDTLDRLVITRDELAAKVAFERERADAATERADRAEARLALVQPVVDAAKIHRWNPDTRNTMRLQVAVDALRATEGEER